MNTFIYKSKEEKILMQSLSTSKLISMEQLSEIKSLYCESVAYHNFVHAMKVAEGVLQLPGEKFTIIEIQSLFIAALFHDAGHRGVSEDLDEFRSLDLAFDGIVDFEKKHDYVGIDYSIVRKAIIGTVFKNRTRNTNKYAIILADLDVSTIGMDFLAFLYYADFPFSVESGVSIDSWLQDMNFFKFLIHIDKNIFREECIREIFPKYLKNIKKYIQISPKKIEHLYIYWKNQDISYDEFYEYARKNGV